MYLRVVSIWSSVFAMAFVLPAGVFVKCNRADEGASLEGCPALVTTRNGWTFQHTQHEYDNLKSRNEPCRWQENTDRFAPGWNRSSGFQSVARGELSYLAPLGSENISAPYFKRCFFRGGVYPPPDWVKHHAKTEITNILFYILNFASIIKFKM